MNLCAHVLYMWYIYVHMCCVYDVLVCTCVVSMWCICVGTCCVCIIFVWTCVVYEHLFTFRRLSPCHKSRDQWEDYVIYTLHSSPKIGIGIRLSVIPQYLLITYCVQAGLMHGRLKLHEGRVATSMELAVSVRLPRNWVTRHELKDYVEVA